MLGVRVMKKRVNAMSGILVLTLALAASCAGGDGNQIRESPCDWRDGRTGCEEEKVQCADPRNCY
jgi:hypothetical protein